MKVTIQKITGHPRILFAAIMIAVARDGRVWIWEEESYYNTEIGDNRIAVGDEISKPVTATRLANWDHEE